MPFSDKIFKAYDVRGIYPTDLNEEAAQAIGLAVANLANGGKVVVGRDMRLSSPSLHQALIDGILQGGASVDDIEMVSIDAMYFAVGKFNYDAGVMVTASHNPSEYNGFKIVTKGVKFVRGYEIEDLIKKNKKAATKGAFGQRDVWPDFIEHLLSFVDKNSFKPLKVVIDAGNGMAGLVIPRLFGGLPFQLSPLFFELDGSFPNHPSNPLIAGATDALSEKVKEQKADLGIIFDGDTDRVFLVDDEGKFVPADVTLLLLAKEFLQREPAAAIVYNLICSKAVPEFVKKWGGQPVRTAVGYVNVRQGLIENQAVMGGELSAHYSFRDNYYADSGFIAALLILELLSRENKKLSELVAEFSPYAKAPEFNLEVRDKDKVLELIKTTYADAKIDELDGVTVSYKDWWCNVRPSNTEPLIRITVEANTPELLQSKHAEVIKLIQKNNL